jgi:uncharacterized protein (DUF2235 family)
MSAVEEKLNTQDKKRVGIFLDGTWNVVDNNTNVWRLYSLCAKVGSDGLRQTCYYTKGVGTLYGEKIRGGIFGYGFDSIIIETYEWLIQQFNEGDELFIFGFSRGAYAARSLAGFVAKCGILKPGSPIGVGELFARYKEGDEARTIHKLIEDRASGNLGATTLLENWMLAYSIPASISMVGVWDTVGALLGEKGDLETGLRIPIQNAFHALAIDEHRKPFKPTLWTQNFHLDRSLESQAAPRKIDHVEQRWFVGAHANVGGGYNSDLLPQLPLAWLMNKASALNFSFREMIRSDDAVYTAPIADSFKDFAYGAYYYLTLKKPFFRTIGADDIDMPHLKTVTVNETIDGSVFERWRRDKNYRPNNLQQWATGHKVDPATLTGAVRTKDPNSYLAN